MFSKESVFELFKSILKIALIAYVAYSCVNKQKDNLFILYEIPLSQAIVLCGTIIIDTGLRISLVYLRIQKEIRRSRDARDRGCVKLPSAV